MLKSAAGQALPQNAAPPRDVRKNLVQADTLFFTFPRLRVTWGDLGIGARVEPAGFRFAAAALVCPCCHGHIVVHGTSAGDSCGAATPGRTGQATMREECEDERQKLF
jgi:hypothetical protein